MKIIRNIQIKGKHQKPILIDLFYNLSKKPKPVVIFCHGYKGYKDWGAWNLAAELFAKNDYFFVKMNFSHNGGTVEQPIDFPDLEAFGNNNYMIELDDLGSVTDWILAQKELETEIDSTRINLIGHSRGGGIVLLKASNDQRIKKVVTWAGVSDFAGRFPKGEVLEQWKKNGVAYITNARTKQEMPHYFQFYEVFKKNEAHLNIKSAVQKLKIPYLIVHGVNDETVSLDEAKKLQQWSKKGQFLEIANANHTFGCSQPWQNTNLPPDLKLAVDNSIEFLK